MKKPTIRKLIKKPTKKQLRKKLWGLCKEIIRKRDGNICFICLREGLEGSSWHTGHLIPSSTCGLYLRYDLRNLASSCYNCNINLGGNGALFLRRVEDVYGKSFADQIIHDKRFITKDDTLFYEERIRHYQEILTWDKAKLFDHTKTSFRDRFPPKSVMPM